MKQVKPVKLKAINALKNKLNFNYLFWGELSQKKKKNT
ncbi:MAG: hypothetical protein CM15mP29_0090 [Alphaproteobacteria bacterium]|nr:MAG: hypothetical protein CM15mP29_0090 [Alphaproteobacteria bacterium]